jgi:uncharacterized protein (TIGR02466 family)
MDIPIIYPLFSTPVMKFNLGREFTKEEIKAVIKYSKKIKKNEGNSLSINNYILDCPEFKFLKNFITEQVNYFMQKVYKPKYLVELYVTQSWLNFTEKNGYHPRHKHPNSFISGVLYIKADKTKDNITFTRNVYRQLMIHSEDLDALNADSFDLNIESGTIVMFPSDLSHFVKPTQSDGTRISLAFNTFIKGTLGDNISLTEVKNL